MNKWFAIGLFVGFIGIGISKIYFQKPVSSQEKTYFHNTEFKEAEEQEQVDPKPAAKTKVTIESFTNNHKVADSLYNRVQSLFESKCLPCHSHRSSKRLHLIVEDPGGNKLMPPFTPWQAYDIFYRVTAEHDKEDSKVRMPKGGERLTDDEMVDLFFWRNAQIVLHQANREAARQNP